MYILKDNKHVYDLSGQGDVLAGITQDNLRIPHKNKINKTPDISAIQKEPILEQVNPRKKAKQDTITDVEKASLK